MSGIVYLNTSDFVVGGEGAKKILSVKIPGASLVLFYSNNCQHCKDVIHIFKQLPGTISGCTFAMVNINNNREVSKMSLECVNKIKYVPLIMLFYNGIPITQYSGPRNVQSIRKFIVDIARENPLFRQQPTLYLTGNKDTKKSIPSYTIGIPKCDNDICYIEMNLE